MAQLSIIVAIAHHRVIGIDNTLPWHLPEDLMRFKALTTGHHIIMGRKTYESLGRLLPGRTTVIVTRNQSYQAAAGALVAHSLKEAVDLCQHDNEVFVIGGHSLYQDGLLMADKLYITQVDLTVRGDAFFPEFDLSQWLETSREHHHSAQGLGFSYITYTRK